MPDRVAVLHGVSESADHVKRPEPDHTHADLRTGLDRILRRLGLVRYQRVVDAVGYADAAHAADPVVTVWAVMTHIDGRASGTVPLRWITKEEAQARWAGRHWKEIEGG